MKNLINYFQFLNDTKSPDENKLNTDSNLSKRMVHHRRDLDSLGEFIKDH